MIVRGKKRWSVVSAAWENDLVWVATSPNPQARGDTCGHDLPKPHDLPRQQGHQYLPLMEQLPLVVDSLGPPEGIGRVYRRGRNWKAKLFPWSESRYNGRQWQHGMESGSSQVRVQGKIKPGAEWVPSIRIHRR